MYLDGIFDLFDLFKRKKKPPEPRIIEHRGMKGYFSTEMIEEFEKNKVDYERAFRQSVDETLDQEEETDPDNPYA